MKVSNLLIFCYLFLFGIPWIFGQQARQVSISASSIEYSASLKKLIVKGRFNYNEDLKTYTLDPATLELVQIADDAVPMDVVSNLNPDYKSPGTISVKQDDDTERSVYRPEFNAVFLDTNSNLLFLPLKEVSHLKVYVIDADRLTLQRIISLPNVPNSSNISTTKNHEDFSH